MSSRLDCAEEVLKSNKNRHPRLDNIVRLDNSLTCEHEGKLFNGTPLLIKYRYNSTSGLMEPYEILDKRDISKDEMEKYKENAYVKGVTKIINNELKRIF